MHLFSSGRAGKQLGEWNKTLHKARTHDRVKVHNVRDFLPAKLNSKINAHFLTLTSMVTHNFIHNFGTAVYKFIILKLQKFSEILGKKI